MTAPRGANLGDARKHRREEQGDWTMRAACRDADPEAFFPNTNKAEDAEEAKTWCRMCPVTNDCLRDALDNRIEFGVWGGFTEQERRTILKIVDKRRLREAS